MLQIREIELFSRRDITSPMEKRSVVYLQNSGIGNIINPVLSPLHEKEYAISVIFVVGQRGELDVHAELQYIYQD